MGLLSLLLPCSCGLAGKMGKQWETHHSNKYSGMEMMDLPWKGIRGQLELQPGCTSGQPGMGQQIVPQQMQ